ncbi:hypothetical protein AB3G45_06640 [Shinella sp. S4-D37]|uniref:hypothetical protein n=1 Tax=Shinella sp. S4-D37 TaxID=3161999 RepID=UPI0034662C38
MKARQSDGQRFRDLAVLLPIATALLLIPPLIRIFATPAMLGGIPLIVVYIFAVWAVAIVVAAIVARHAHQAPADDPQERPDTTGRP